MSQKINLIDNSSIKGREEKFTTVEVDLKKIVTGWKDSVFSFEWLTPEGHVQTPEQLGTERAEQHNNVSNHYKQNTPLERPILGLGMMDNVEIGSRKDVLLTLHTLGVTQLEVHIPKSCIEDFQKFM